MAQFAAPAPCCIALIACMYQPMTPLRILITGGAGFLGVNLCRHLLAAGASVRSLDIAASTHPERDQVDVVAGDIRDPSVVDRAMRDIDVVIHAAAALPLSNRREIWSVEVDGTRLLLQSACDHGVSRFIYISSTAVYGVPKHHPIREDDPLHGVGPYGKAKIAAEALCLDYRRRGLCVPILRPKSFVGPERLGVFELLCNWAYEGRNFPVLGKGDNRYQLLDVADLCRAIELCVTSDFSIANDTFNVAARRFGTIREDFQAVLDRAGQGGRIVAIPAAPALWALRVLRLLRLSPLYPWIYETVTEDSWVDTERIERVFGFVPTYSNRDALVRTYDWYRAHRAEIPRTAGVTHRVPWHRGLLGVAKWLF